jgi:hypothetical protein
MKRCKQCGVLNPDTATRCGSCDARGDSLVAVSEEGKEALAAGAAPAAVDAPAPPPAPEAPAAPAVPAPKRAVMRRLLIGVGLVLFLGVGGAAAFLARLYYGKPAVRPAHEAERPRGPGFPAPKETGPTTPEGPTAAASEAGEAVWRRELDSQTHASITIDHW